MRGEEITMPEPLTLRDRSILTCRDCGSSDYSKGYHNEGCTSSDFGYEYPEEKVISALILLKEKMCYCEEMDISVEIPFCLACKSIKECFQIDGVKQ